MRRTPTSRTPTGRTRTQSTIGSGPARIQPQFQFLIVLLETDPPVWRRILVPGRYSFWDLHVAIQDAMGWLDYHLHEFQVWNELAQQMQRIGIPDDEWGEPALAGWDQPIAPVVRASDVPMLYRYDFGDNWRHVVSFETMVSADGTKRPRCIGGARKCPPEDCGGVGGYANFLQAIENPRHPEHKEFLTWVGGSYDPDDFDPAAVHFDDPAKRLKYAMED